VHDSVQISTVYTRLTKASAQLNALTYQCYIMLMLVIGVSACLQPADCNTLSLLHYCHCALEQDGLRSAYVQAADQAFIAYSTKCELIKEREYAENLSVISALLVVKRTETAWKSDIHCNTSLHCTSYSSTKHLVHV
jgi:hypothetical protein